MTTLAAELIADEAALYALVPEWDALWQHTPDATAFQAPAWLLAWWAEWGTGAPRVSVLRDDGGRLVGVLPLYELRDEGKILPMGAGLSDYHDALLAPEAPHDAASALLRTALDGASMRCDLIDLPPAAGLRDAATPAGWRASETTAEPCPVLRLGGDLRATIPPGQHRNVRQSRNRADKLGGWSVAVATDATRAEMLDTMWRLHAQRWGASDPAVARFHAACVPALCAAGCARIVGLRLAGRLAAVFYVLRGASAVLLYLGGFDADCSYASPGTLLFASVIETAIADGLAEAHFLRGAEAYKYAWGATDRWNTARHLRRT